MPHDEAYLQAKNKIESVNNHPRITTANSRMPAHIRLFVTPFVDGTVEDKGKHMPIDLIHRKPKNKTQASQLALTNTSPSPIWGKLEGGSHAT